MPGHLVIMGLRKVLNYITQTPDVGLTYQGSYAAPIIALRGITYPTTSDNFRVYNTYTDASNGEWGGIDSQAQSNLLFFGAERTGQERYALWR